MPRRSRVSQLPANIRAELQQRLINNSFSDYEGLASWLAEEGFPVSISAIHRYGQALENLLPDIDLTDDQSSREIIAPHELRRTNADKRRAVELLLGDGESDKWSDREIAQRGGVTPGLVRNVRKSLAVEDRPQREYINRWGQHGTMNIGGLRGSKGGFSKGGLSEAGVGSNDARLISRDLDGLVVFQRQEDGYINATQLCKAVGKLLADYLRLSSTTEYLEALSADMGIPISGLVQIRKGGNDKSAQGTWTHPEVSIDIGQWLSPQFRMTVNRWVREWMTTGQNPVSVATTAPTTIVNDPLLELIQADMQQVRVATPFVLAWKYDALKSLNPHRAEMLDAAKQLVMSNCAEEESLLNPPNIGKLVEERSGLKTPGAYVNKILGEMEYQQKSQTAKCPWILTEQGTQYGRAVPYKSGTGHEGYQVLWMSSVIEQILEYLKNKSA